MKPLPTVVLCVDDHVVDFFRLWCQALSLTGSSCPVVILPFSKRVSQIEKVSEQFGFSMNSEAPDDWIKIGRSIYGDESYRPGLPRRQFFSKLAALSLNFPRLVYYDVNAIPFTKPEIVAESIETSDAEIIFRWQLSSLGQNIPNAAVMRDLNKMNPSIGRGWSANFFVCRGNLLKLDEAIEFSKTDGLRKKFGTAPEQSFLTHFFAHKKTKIDAIAKYSGSERGVSCRSDLWVEYEGERPVLFSDDGCGARVKPHFVKWNGNVISRTMDHHWLTRFIRREYQALGKSIIQ